MLFRKTSLCIRDFIASNLVIVSGLLEWTEIGNMHLYNRQTDMCMNHTTWVLRLMIARFLFNFISLTSVRFPSVALISFWVFTKCMEVFFSEKFWVRVGILWSFNLHLSSFEQVENYVSFEVGVYVFIYLFINQLVKLR